MKITQKPMEKEAGVPLLDEEDEEDGELDIEDLLKLGDEEAIPKPDT